MKLIGDFFKVIETNARGSEFLTTIELNPNHIVYSGHFPGHPVTPGVIQIQIVHELLEKHFSHKLKLMEMPQCKFLKVLDPNKDSRIVIYIEFKWIDTLLNVKARGEYGQDIFFKFTSIYSI